MKSKANAQKNKAESREHILSYLDQYGIVDKDSFAQQKKSILAEKQFAKRHGVTRRILDLHGLHAEAAEKKIRQTFLECGETGVKELLLIHGYGLHSKPDQGPVLKNLVQSLLEHGLASQVKSFKPASLRDGGAGATAVFLR